MTSAQIDLFSGFILIAIGLVLVVIMLIAHIYVEAIESRLSNCSYIEDNKRVWSNAGLLGKVMRGGIISMVLIMPKMHAKRGLIDVQELSRLPKRYRYLLMIPFIACCVLLVFLIALSVGEKYIA
ncbi:MULTISPECIES: hypothetical protein [Pseudomonas syringae group]|uniref:Uncharacterized protein n=2 Tax=Pseudomonas avellanae TaxID=46257 RepID=A0AAD0DS76_9PSED|nr:MULTISPECIES: hypothetical protein [Pseudomonas syringae group]EGH12697.1 hypothetical protein PSYMP_21996 [Pseudomonas amygdali pv. morsprunorum str. M302280]NAT25133.1 hypothetical protein [Pseudomonas syringae pv. actinidifoliorum]AVB21027.1 hypothetical protein BKM03_18725 [Pseudomonas avellanae]KWS62295.1 hypothetical protein AL055_26945 [Pseudomonas amygdali pv. morsprunorum]NAT37757.1 hypothetical protein [Pseudomonas syringae pv. actinidifoliorum]